jgi:hypothetical protein
MDRNNPIVDLAIRAYEGRFPPERIQQEVDNLRSESVSRVDVDDAMQTVSTPECPTPLVHLVGGICV